MQNIIFSQTIKENKDNPQILTIIKELAYDVCKKRLVKNQGVNLIAEDFGLMCEALRSEETLNPKSVANVIQGITEALSENDERYVYKLIYEKEQIEKQILERKTKIRKDLQNALTDVEAFLRNSDFQDKEKMIEGIDEKMLCDLQMLGILKETTEAAFLTALEHQEDVRDAVSQISKNLVFDAINRDEIDKTRFLEAAQIICETAINIANVEHKFARWLIAGALSGTRDGLVKAVENFIDDIKSAPDNKNLLEKSQEFIKMEEGFVETVRDLAAGTNEPAASIVNEILQSSLDSYLAKFKRMRHEISTQISLRLEELGGKDAIASKIEEIKREISQKSDKIKDGFNSSETFEALKKELSELEKKAEEKINDIKEREIGENLKAKSKALGEKLYKAAENLIKNAKEKIGKKDG